MRALRPALLVLAAVAIGLAVGVLVLSRDDGPTAGDATLADGRALRLRTSVEPRVHLFGEPVTAETEFLVDPELVVPSSLRVESRFAPYTQVSGERTETRVGDLVRIRYRYRLQCTSVECVPTDDKREVELESGQVVYGGRDAGAGRLRTTGVVNWPSFEVVSRLGPFDVEQARWRADIADLPEPTLRSTPTTLGAALLGSSALLALLGAVLIATQLRGRRVAAEAAEEMPRQSLLERALAGVIATSSNGAGADQRRSLERLARELAVTGRTELASRARRLAWSPRAAARPEVDSLAADVRAVLEEERR